MRAETYRRMELRQFLHRAPPDIKVNRATHNFLQHRNVSAGQVGRYRLAKLNADRPRCEA